MILESEQDKEKQECWQAYSIVTNMYQPNPKRLRNWLEKSEYSEAIKKAKEEFKDNLERDIVLSLAKVAKGYEYTQKTKEYSKSGSGKMVVRKEVVKNVNVDPNVGAAIFLLTNIAPSRWSNKQKQEISGEIATGLNIIVKSEDDAELLKKMQEH